MQMQSFATLVEANEQFKLAKGRRRLDDREQALLNAVYQVGEHELAKLRVRYEKKTAEARQERERQRFMGTLFSLVGAEGRKAALTFLTRPYIEYYRPVKQITGTATPAAGLVDEIVVEPNPSGAILAQQGSDEPQERRYRSMVEAFSGWPKAFLLFVESSFARMSPLTTAIWFGLVVAGAVALGWAQRTYLIATYDFYKEQAKLVKPAEEKRREVERELEKARTDLRVAQLERKTDQQALTDARAQLAQKEKDWQVREQKMRQDHQKTQELLAKNAGEAAQAQLTALDAQVKLLQSQNDALTKERDVAQNRSIEIERERDTKAARESLLEGMLTKEKSFGKAETKRADLAQEGEMNGRALSAYSKALIALVSEVFYERRVTREELWHRRNEFAEKFNRLSLENREILDAFSIPRTLQ